MLTLNSVLKAMPVFQLFLLINFLCYITHYHGISSQLNNDGIMEWENLQPSYLWDGTGQESMTTGCQLTERYERNSILSQTVNEEQ